MKYIRDIVLYYQAESLFRQVWDLGAFFSFLVRLLAFYARATQGVIMCRCYAEEAGYIVRPD